MVSFIDKYLPDEWQSTIHAFRDMSHHAASTSHHKNKVAVSFLIPAAIGGLVGLSLSSSITSTFQQGLLTFLGILTGFVVTLMLFTGKTDNAESLTLEKLKEYRDKVLYLLWSQTMSLITYLFTASLSIFYLILIDDTKPYPLLLDTKWLSVQTKTFLDILIMGGFFVAIIRTLMLPYQIYEIHRFSLDTLVSEKEEEINKAIRESRSKLQNERVI